MTPKRPRPHKTKSPRRRAVSEKTPKTYRLNAKKIAAARKILRAPTDTAAIEEALDMVLFRKELMEGAVAMLGVPIANYDD